jgi:hypothetical protein
MMKAFVLTPSAAFLKGNVLAKRLEGLLRAGREA